MESTLSAKAVVDGYMKHTLILRLGEVLKEKDIMTLHVNDITLEIPEDLLEDMKNTLHFESNEKIIEEISITVNALKPCFSPSELEEKNFNDRVIEYIKDEIAFFK